MRIFFKERKTRSRRKYKAETRDERGRVQRRE